MLARSDRESKALDIQAGVEKGAQHRELNVVQMFGDQQAFGYRPARAQATRGDRALRRFSGE
jgi:hypothetical protein